jgi:acetyl esterase/lipase
MKAKTNATLVAGLLAAVSLHGADVPLRHRGYDYQPRKLANAGETRFRLPFLQPGRDWERLDLYYPKTGGDKLPCLVVLYGGGYGDKVLPLDQAAPLLDRGYVLAVPDYALQSGTPVPLCGWDAANAIRHLRAKAAEYRIDPERIGIWGFSAGGWIIQDQCYADATTTTFAQQQSPQRQVTGQGFLPMREPHALYREQSASVQAAVSDWGAGKLTGKRRAADGKEEVVADAALSPDDPPLMTCFGGEPRELARSSTGFLQALGVPAEPVFLLDVKSTHVPSHAAAGKTADGKDCTWGTAVYDFLDRHVKNPTVATAPEIRWSADGQAVELLTVHPTGKIHVTVDGSVPTASAPGYTGPIPVKPGLVVRAIVVRAGLNPSRVASLTVPKIARPVIGSVADTYLATVGQPFRAKGSATGEKVQWFAGGRLGESYRTFGGESFNPPRHIPWLQMDAATGVLAGTPRVAGTYPVIVAAWSMTGSNPKQPGEVVADARLVIITVADPAAHTTK